MSTGASLRAKGTPRRARLAGVVATVLAAALLAGCTRGSTSSRPPIHLNPNMDHQPKALPQSASTFFYDGATERAPLPGTVARGDLRDDTALWTGTDAAGGFIATSPLPVDDGLRARGAERYAIYCLPCHGASGAGNGVAATRGRIPAADLHDDRLRAMADGQLFDVLTQGVGLMPSFRSRLPVEDRWAVIAHVRELQAK